MFDQLVIFDHILELGFGQEKVLSSIFLPRSRISRGRRYRKRVIIIFIQERLHHGSFSCSGKSGNYNEDSFCLHYKCLLITQSCILLVSRTADCSAFRTNTIFIRCSGSALLPSRPLSLRGSRGRRSRDPLILRGSCLPHLLGDKVELSSDTSAG